TSRLPLDLDIAEPAVEHCFADLDEIGFEPDEYRLRLRIAEPHVVFEDFGNLLVRASLVTLVHTGISAGSHHQAEKEDAAKRKAFRDASFQRRLYDGVNDLLRLFFGKQ